VERRFDSVECLAPEPLRGSRDIGQGGLGSTQREPRPIVFAKCSVKKSQMDAETYRRKAEQYFTFARRMRDPNAKAALMDLAAHWMQMAKQSERLDYLQEEHVEAN
jgi:hypothetical protein